MAKASPKSAKTATAKARNSKSTKPAAPDIEKISEDVLSKLRQIDVDLQLQADIEWCLGSFRADRNPVGLYDMAMRAVYVLKAEQEKKTKGVTAKLIGDLEKVLASR